MPVTGLGPDTHDAALGSELGGVREQIDEHLRQARLVSFQERQIIGQRHLQSLPAQREQRADERLRVRHDFGELDTLAPYAQLT